MLFLLLASGKFRDEEVYKVENLAKKCSILNNRWYRSRDLRINGRVYRSFTLWRLPDLREIRYVYCSYV